MMPRALTGAIAAAAAGIIVASATLLGMAPPAPAQGSCPVPPGDTVTLTYAGDQVQPIGIPDGVDEVVAEVRGGHGGHEDHTAQGGQGGLVDGTIPVSPGDCLEIYVGGYGAGEGWGYGSGGDRGTQVGPGRDGTGGGGGSAILRSGTPLIVAGGGGGGGGNGSAEFDGGAGGDGAGGDGPGTPGGSDGGNGQGVPVTTFMDLGGLGGFADGIDGDGGEDGSVDLFAGAAGGGGGGFKGGGGGAAWVGTGTNNIEKPVGGGGGGGGDSHAADVVTGAVFSVGGVDCPTGGGSAACDGEVTLSWRFEPAHVAPYAGGSQTTPITSPFPRPLEAKVTAANGEPVPGTTVEFELPSSGGYAEFVESGQTTATATTDANGIVTSPDLVAGDVAGNWSATATVEDVSSPARFPLRTAPATTSMALHSTATPSVSGQPISFLAVVGASPSSAGVPQGSVHFEVDGVQVGASVPVDAQGIAQSQEVELGAGNHQVAARFEGTPEFTSVNAEVPQPVERGPAAVALSSSPNPSTGGAPVTFTATVMPIAPATGTPTGVVRFRVDNGPFGHDSPIDPSGIAAATFPVGEGHHLVEARYLGDDEFLAASGVIVQAAGDTITATDVSSSDPASTYGEPVTFTATMSGPGPLGGAVTFRSINDQGQQTLCDDVEVEVTLDAATAECVPGSPLEPGEHRVAASFSPAQQGVSPSSGQTAQYVGRAPTTSQAVATPNPVTFGSPFELHTDISAAPTAGTPDGLARFSVDGLPSGPPVAVGPLGATLPSNELPALGGGAHAFTAAYAGSNRFAPSRAAGVLVVDPVATATALATSRQDAPAGSAITFTATVSPEGPGSDEVKGEIQFWVDGVAIGEPVPITDGAASSPPIADLERGEHDVRATFSGPPSFAPSDGAILQRIGPRARPTATIPCPPTRVMLTDMHRHRGRMFVSGVADRGLVGRRVSIVRGGGRVVGWTNVLADGTFWARLSRPASRQRASRYWAKVAGFRSARLVPHRRIAIVKRRPAGEQRGRARVRVTVRVRGAAKRLALGRQLRCGKASSTRVRRVRVRRHGDRRVTVKLRRPRAGEPFAVYRLWLPGRRAYSPAIVVRAHRR